MTAITVLKIIASLGTIATGTYSLLWPTRIKGFTGLDVTGPRGVTEIRAILGAFFIGLGAAAMFLNATAAYQMLGIAYLVVAITRSFSMFVDRSVSQSNVVSVLAEVILGVILVA